MDKFISEKHSILHL